MTIMRPGVIPQHVAPHKVQIEGKMYAITVLPDRVAVDMFERDTLRYAINYSFKELVWLKSLVVDGVWDDDLLHRLVDKVRRAHYAAN